MKNLFKCLILLLLVSSCTKTPTDYSNLNFSFGGGVYIVNEGNFRGGNGSLSFFSYDSSKIFNDLFQQANNRPLGDVPNSMAIKGSYAYIVVNNSGKIEVVDESTLKSVATIAGLNSPRNISFVNDYKAYVSSLYSDSVAVIDLTSFRITGYINLRRTSESICVAGTKAFISYWTEGSEVMVVNTFSDKVIDSIKVGVEPESMTFDKNGRLWVLCNGGWARNNFAELYKINTTTDAIEKTYTFSTKQASPSCLRINGTGDILYYLDNGIRQMNVASADLPSVPMIVPESGQYFYKIGINSLNNDIFVTDAVDFVQPGYVIRYNSDGKFQEKQKAGIIPGAMCFKLRINPGI